MHKIIIGIVSDVRLKIDENETISKIQYLLNEKIVNILASKADVIMLPHEKDSSENYINIIDALIFVNSSYSIDPFYYSEAKKGDYLTNNKKSDFEFDMLRKAINKQIPILGLGNGMQMINVFFGGSLYQNILEEVPGVINHQQTEKNIKLSQTYHDNVIVPNTELARILGTESLQVNSAHTQAIKKLGDGLKINAISKVDNIIEGVEAENPNTWIIGLQWLAEHVIPKDNQENSRETLIFEALLKKSAELKDKRNT